MGKTNHVNTNNNVTLCVAFLFQVAAPSPVDDRALPRCPGFVLCCCLRNRTREV
jgi:hypothetical protein